MAIFSYHPFTFTGGDKPEQVDATSVSADFFSTLGTQPMIGRVFTSDEDQPGHGNVVLLEPPFLAGSLCLEPRHCGALRHVGWREVPCCPGVMPANFRLPVLPRCGRPWRGQTRKSPFEANITTW